MKYLALAVVIMSFLGCTQQSKECGDMHNLVDVVRDAKTVGAPKQPDLDSSDPKLSESYKKIIKQIIDDTYNGVSTYKIHKIIDASIYCKG